MILPLRKETLVLELSVSEAADRLRYVTGKRSSKPDRPVIFVGRVDDERFNITRYLSRPENYMPQVEGKFESTSKGSILFLRYTLQFSSRMFVVFWTVTTLMFAMFLWFVQTRWQLAVISLAVLVFNVVFTHISFHRQYRRSREAIMKVLEISG